MHLLFLHTRPASKPRNFKAPVTEISNWPRLIEVSWLVMTQNTEIKKQTSLLIKPLGFEIPETTVRETGISTAKAMAEGILIADALKQLSAALENADQVVAHNMGLHERILGAEFLRANLPDVLARKKRICNMLAGTAFCKIPGTYGNKWPSQEELHQKLFDKKYNTATVSEVEITARCFWGLEKKQVFSK